MEFHSVKCLIQLKILIISALLYDWSLLSNGQFSVGLGIGTVTISFYYCLSVTVDSRRDSVPAGRCLAICPAICPWTSWAQLSLSWDCGPWNGCFLTPSCYWYQNEVLICKVSPCIIYCLSLGRNTLINANPNI